MRLLISRRRHAMEKAGSQTTEEGANSSARKNSGLPQLWRGGRSKISSAIAGRDAERSPPAPPIGRGFCVVLAFAGAATLAQQLPPAPRAGSLPTPPVPAVRLSVPTPLPDPTGPALSYAELTRGKPITIAGRSIQLPHDAYVNARADIIDCLPGYYCGDPPEYQIVRGSSRVWVSINSGKVRVGHIARGEESAFDFLYEGLGQTR